MRQIYLDYNATTPIAPSIQEAMLPFITEYYGNPSSTHALGRACQEAIEDARLQVAGILGADSDEVIFTSGGTESNNLALKGVMLREPVGSGAHLVISAFEHPAIEAPAKFLTQLGYELTVVPVNSDGVVDPEAVEAALRPDTKLVSIMHANNELGTVQPIREISEICRAREVLLHTDAAQTVGKIGTYVNELGVDLLTVAGHKLYAPKGVGALFVKQGVALEPFMHGAGHEGGLRAGTENTPYIVALGKATALAVRGLGENGDRMAALRDRLLDRLTKGIGDELTVHGGRAERLPNTLSVNLPRVHGADVLAQIPEICASTGSACHSGTTNLSASLRAIGLTAEQAQGTVRLSVGWYTSEEDIDRAASKILGVWENLVSG